MQGKIHTDVWQKIRSAQGESQDADLMARGVGANIAEYVISFQKK
jgi:hypothetical protein